MDAFDAWEGRGRVIIFYFSITTFKHKNKKNIAN